jgi:hypothetical protein
MKGGSVVELPLTSIGVVQPAHINAMDVLHGELGDL